MKRLLVVGLSLTLGACAVVPTHMYDLIDAQDDEQVESAVREAAAQLGDRRARLGVRTAAALVLGRLRSDDPRAIAALQGGLSGQQPPALRRYSAWALGELRSPSALPVLTAALRSSIDDETGAYVLEAVAKHYAVMAGNEPTLVSVVEAMVFFGGNRATGVPAMYDLLGARTRTVGVNVQVLHHAIADLQRDSSPSAQAALYNATLELLTKLAARRDEVRAGPAAWSARIDAAFDAAQVALQAEPDHTALLVLWYLGQLAKDPEFAAPAARVLVGPDAELASRPTLHPRSAARLVAIWALARMQVYALGPRKALLLDVLSKEMEPEVLRLFGDLSVGDKDLDALQRVLLNEGEGSR